MSATIATCARTATVTGREHLRLGRNNQDGACVAQRGPTTVAVVTDGCSSQPFSEVGARLGARALASIVLGLDAAPLAELPELALSQLGAWLGRLVASFEHDEAPALLEQYGLFTVLCAVQRGPDAVVFGSGDGAVLVDERLVRLDSGEANAPAYLGYRLLGQSVPAQRHHLGPAERVALATDGLDGWLARSPKALPALLDEPQLWHNPAHLQRRLNVLHAGERFQDDATLAVLATEAR